MIWTLILGPDGMTIDPDTGELSWPNPTDTEETITVQVAEGAVTNVKTFSLRCRQAIACTWTAEEGSWLSISPEGVLTGTPALEDLGVTVIAVAVVGAEAVSDVALSSSATVDVSVDVNPNPPNIVQTTVPDGEQNTYYEYTLTGESGTPWTDGKPYDFSSDDLPVGMQIGGRLESTAGKIEGYPPPGDWTFTVKITDSIGSFVTTTFSWHVAYISPVVVQGQFDPPHAHANVAYSCQLTGLFGKPPYAFSATGLPAGITCDTDGLVTGTPTVVGDYPVDVTITDDIGGTSTTSMFDGLAVQA